MLIAHRSVAFTAESHVAVIRLLAGDVTVPIVSGSSLSYSIEILDGTVPAESGAVTLFTDPLSPLSAVSLAGMNRRDRGDIRSIRFPGRSGTPPPAIRPPTFE